MKLSDRLLTYARDIIKRAATIPPYTYREGALASDAREWLRQDNERRTKNEQRKRS